MIKQISLFCVLLAATTASAADINVKLYGKINVSYEFLQDLDDDWVSNASRIGIKGDYRIADSWQAVYQVEQEVNLLKGGTSQDTLFSTRNSFFGLKSNDYGRLIFGAHDTPLKMSQGKIDQFNDLIGDIKHALVGEIRSTDSYMYNSPVIAGFQFNAMHVPSDNNFNTGQSYSVTYKKDGLYMAGAFDQDMRKNDKQAAQTTAYDSYRAVVQYSWDKLVLGALYQSSEAQNLPGSNTEDAVMVSAGYDYQDFTLRAQYNDSDIVVRDHQVVSLGVDYHLNKAARFYLNCYATEIQSERTSAVEVGGEYQF